MRTREEIIAELQRVAKALASDSVSQNDFERTERLACPGLRMSLARGIVRSKRRA